MRRIHVLCGFALVAIASVALPVGAADPGAPAPREGPIDALVGRLGDADTAARERAAEELAKLGDRAEGALRRGLAGAGDPDQRSRIEGLLAAVERGRAEGPALVTVRMTGATPTEVFAELAKQGGVELAPGAEGVLEAAGVKSVDVELDHVPFWQALLGVCGRCGVSFHSVDEKGRVVIEAARGSVAPAPAATAGPFLVTLNHVEINTSKGLAFAGRRPNNVQNNRWQKPPCRMYLFAWGEPRVRPLLWFIDSVDECEVAGGKDGAGKDGGAKHGGGKDAPGKGRGGNVGLPPPPGWEALCGGQVNSPNETQFTLGLPPEPGGSIKRLKLTGRFVVGKGMEKLQVPDVLSLRDAEHFVGGFRVRIVQVNKIVEGQYGYQLVAYRDGKPAADWETFRMLMDRYGCRLVDASGEALFLTGGSVSSGPDEARVTQSLTCEWEGGRKTGEPVRLEWDFPAEVRQVRVALEFREVPLP